MNKLFLSILLLINSGLIAEQNSDCVSPSEYVMQFLANSTTLWKGSRDWINKLDNNSNEYTVFARTRFMPYEGVYARVLGFFLQNMKASEDTVFPELLQYPKKLA